MNNTKANFWLSRKKTKDIAFSYEAKQKWRLVKGSVIAILLGIIIGFIIIGAQNRNPFEFLATLFTLGFNKNYAYSTIDWWCIYIIAALAVGICFKAGLFNMGVPGQMMMGSGISLILYQLVIKQTIPDGGRMNAGWVILIFLICIFSGAIMAGIAGVLKSLFNIHEVVTTIMLNYVTLYLMGFVFKTYDKLKGPGISSSPIMPSGSISIGGAEIVLPIILAVIAVVAISVLLSKTTLGFKMKAVGASPDAAKYAGYDVKRKLIQSMVIAGVLSGIAGFISVFTVSPNISVASPVLPPEGYDAVAITLIAFNNPLGSTAVAFMWSILKSAGPSVSGLYGLPTQMSQLIFGILIYFAAISVVFINWYPILKLKIMIAMSGNKADQIKIKNLHKTQLQYRRELLDVNKSEDVKKYKELIQEQISEQKELLDKTKAPKKQQEIKKQIKMLKNDMNYFVKEYRKNLKEQIKKISQEIKIIKKNNYVEKINSAKQGIDRRRFETIKGIESEALSKAELVKSDCLSVRDKYKEDLKARKNWMKNKLRNLKKEYKFKQKQNAVWLESETGIKNHYWEMRNGKIESKAVINKIKINSHNAILSIKSDAEMEKLDLRSKYKHEPLVLAKKERAVVDKMNALIIEAKAKELSEIKKEKEKVAELIRVYKEAKKENEAKAKEILAKKKSTKTKLAMNLKMQKAETQKFVKDENVNLDAENKSLSDLVADTINDQVKLGDYKEILEYLQKDLKHKNAEFTKSLNSHLAVKKDLVDESERLLKELYAENQRDIKTIAKINDQNNADGVSLVDIRLAYNQRKQRTTEWYKAERSRAIEKHNAFVKQYNDEKTRNVYKQIEKALHDYKKEAKKIGTKETIETLTKKKALLSELIKKVKSVWPEEYSDTDRPKWSKKRMHIYNKINSEQAKLSKIAIVINAQDEITTADSKYKWIIKMYDEKIKQFKDEYIKNKKVDIISAQAKYQNQIETLISKLEKQVFSKNNQLKEVK